jgi:heme/copper-type cytochrome/quinol oxidase subunit 2
VPRSLSSTAIGLSLNPLTLAFLDPATASDADLRHLLVRVVITGTLLIGVSTALLILYFRSFEKEGEGKGSFRPTLLLITLIGSLIFGCLVLLMISFVRL